MKIDITVLLDRSGSMETRKKDHIGGLRSFVEDQKNQGETDFTLVQFDSSNPFELVFDGVNIDNVDVAKIDLIPRGGTPLLDALGKTVAHIEQRTKGKEVQPVLMIITDGEENQSREWTKERVYKAIKDKENDWKILYLGADVDAFAEASNIGISNTKAVIKYDNSDMGTQNMYHANTRSIKRMRGSYNSGLSKEQAMFSADYTQQEVNLCANPDELLDKDE